MLQPRGAGNSSSCEQLGEFIFEGAVIIVCNDALHFVANCGSLYAVRGPFDNVYGAKLISLFEITCSLIH